MKDPFDEAHALFKNAEKELARREERLSDTARQLLEATLEVNGIDRKIEAFANDANADAAAAAHLIADQERARNVALLLEQAEAFLEGEVAKAKVAVSDAELKAAAAQRDAQFRSFETLIETFLKSNAVALQRMTRVQNLCGVFAEMANGASPEGARANTPMHVSHLVRPIAATISRLWDVDEQFQAGCASMDIPASSMPIRSNRITQDERMRARAGGFKALLPQEAATDDFNPRFADECIREAEAKIEYHRGRAAEYEARLATHPNDPNLESGVEEHTAAAVRHEDIVERWNDKIASRPSTGTSG